MLPEARPILALAVRHATTRTPTRLPTSSGQSLGYVLFGFVVGHVIVQRLSALIRSSTTAYYLAFSLPTIKFPFPINFAVWEHGLSVFPHRQKPVMRDAL